MVAVLVPSLSLSYWLNSGFALTCAALFLLNLLYTVSLKLFVIAGVTQFLSRKNIARFDS
jgi:hypothetical protein